jgi:hypothetical protein
MPKQKSRIYPLRFYEKYINTIQLNIHNVDCEIGKQNKWYKYVSRITTLQSGRKQMSQADMIYDIKINSTEDENTPVGNGVTTEAEESPSVGFVARKRLVATVTDRRQ